MERSLKIVVADCMKLEVTMNSFKAKRFLFVCFCFFLSDSNSACGVTWGNG